MRWKIIFKISPNKKTNIKHQQVTIWHKAGEQKVKGGIPRKKQEMSKAVFNEIKKLDWKKLDDKFLCDEDYDY